MNTPPNNVAPMYTRALLQMIAYRNISSAVAKVLRPYDLNATKWIIVSIVADHPQQYRVTDIAQMLQVEGTLITNQVHDLTKRGLLMLEPHPSDKRARLLTATLDGKSLVTAVELAMRQQLQPIIKGTKTTDMDSYFNCLKIIIANTSPLSDGIL